jgi:hypothetical protein
VFNPYHLKLAGLDPDAVLYPVAPPAQPSPIRTKVEMYDRLSAGEFGNTIPQFLSVADWQASPDSSRFSLWGVRSARHSMHPDCRLNCPAAEVAEYAERHFPDGPNISMMVDNVATITAWLEIVESDTGLVVEGIEWPAVDQGWTWRNSMRDPIRRQAWSGASAKAVLRRHLNPNSLDDLWEVLDRWPGHVVELSALDCCFGTTRGRNAVVWEVRDY